ncbi:HAD-IB family hydrolase [Paenarthrobacter sp. NPDC058040]|uniref:HAD-IB family hydrolase n=1 Tax=Paenarthrobacter sp. NPDC058040 TaxID=3346309 RepID=UPI0036DF5FA5
MTKQAAAAYFDVDGTLTPLTTMFELLLFDAGSSGRLAEGRAFLSGLRLAKAAGAPREETNRTYFRWWAGRSVVEVEELGREWFSAVPRSGLVFPDMASRVEWHRNRDHRIVLVSGSFAPALQPFADYLRADDVLTASALVERGRYTGDITEPMIGEGKAVAVAAHAAQHSLDLAASHGYGDDISDVPFLELTGNRVIVNNPKLPTSAPGWSRRLLAEI